MELPEAQLFCVGGRRHEAHAVSQRAACTSAACLARECASALNQDGSMHASDIAVTGGVVCVRRVYVSVSVWVSDSVLGQLG